MLGYCCIHHPCNLNSLSQTYFHGVDFGDLQSKEFHCNPHKKNTNWFVIFVFAICGAKRALFSSNNHLHALKVDSNATV